MVFNSYFFIFIYLPVLIAGWFGLNRKNARAAEYFLIGMSLWFYGCFGWAPLAVLLLSIVTNYLIGRGIEGRRGTMTAGVIWNLALLCWFKYVTPSISSAVSSSGGNAASLPTFLTLSLPVGLSFYTFTQISYLVDRYHGVIPQDPFLTYALYAAYFPKLVEGPITRYEEIVSQFRDGALRHFHAENFTRGLILFLFGLGKKTLLADVLSPAVTHGLESVYYLDTLSYLVTMTGYVLQLYMDFSGFCDMAMGISWMLNIRLPRNFDAPLRSTTYAGLWRRWHMTLSRFFTQYVYIPLGGSRHGMLRTFGSTMLIFLLSALWHGTGVSYLVWGAVNGILVFLSNWYRRKCTGKTPAAAAPDDSPGPASAKDASGPAHSSASAEGNSGSSPARSSEGAAASTLTNPKPASAPATPEPVRTGPAPETGSRPPVPSSVRAGASLHDGLCRLRTFVLFTLTMTFFAAPSLQEAFIMFRQLLVPRFPGWLYRMAGQLDAAEFWAVNKALSLLAPSLADPIALAELLLVLLICLVLVLQPRTAQYIAQTMTLRPRNAFLVGVLAFWCLSSLTGVSTYIYFQF